MPPTAASDRSRALSWSRRIRFCTALHGSSSRGLNWAHRQRSDETPGVAAVHEVYTPPRCPPKKKKLSSDSAVSIHSALSRCALRRLLGPGPRCLSSLTHEAGPRSFTRGGVRGNKKKKFGYHVREVRTSAWGTAATSFSVRVSPRSSARYIGSSWPRLTHRRGWGRVGATRDGDNARCRLGRKNTGRQSLPGVRRRGSFIVRCPGPPIERPRLRRNCHIRR